jgi:F-type H+-transporting ATPase subunit epsilon
MRLVIATPVQVAADIDDAVAVRAEDASGKFGILDHHADFLTVLAISVVSWRRRDGGEGHCAVRGGVLSVNGGATVSVATREAVVSDDLVKLERDVLARFRRTGEEEKAARASSTRLYLAAVRRMLAYLRPERVARSLSESAPSSGPPDA